jgi:hypothetical protein
MAFGKVPQDYPTRTIRAMRRRECARATARRARTLIPNLHARADEPCRARGPDQLALDRPRRLQPWNRPTPASAGAQSHQVSSHQPTRCRQQRANRLEPGPAKPRPQPGATTLRLLGQASARRVVRAVPREGGPGHFAGQSASSNYPTRSTLPQVSGPNNRPNPPLYWGVDLPSHGGGGQAHVGISPSGGYIGMSPSEGSGTQATDLPGQPEGA